MKAEILAIGSELVDGQKLDTNSRWISQTPRRAGPLGALPHDPGRRPGGERLGLRASPPRRSDLVVVTGGIGPTQDDLTREALAAVAGVPLVEDAASLRAIEAIFARRNRVMADRNRVQALFPEGSEILPNPVGTAPGIWMAVGPSRFACLPGVPSEMRLMFDEQVAPRLRGARLVRPGDRPPRRSTSSARGSRTSRPRPST